MWQEVLDGVREIKAGEGKRTNVEAKSYVVRVRCATQVYSDPYYFLLEVAGVPIVGGRLMLVN